MAVKHTPHLPQVRHHLMVQSRTDSWLPRPLQRFRIIGHWMEFPIPRPLIRMHLDMRTEARENNLVQILDGYFAQDAHHLNVNVFGTEKADRCNGAPGKRGVSELYHPCFRLCCEVYLLKSQKQQLDVIARTCHKTL